LVRCGLCHDNESGVDDESEDGRSDDDIVDALMSDDVKMKERNLLPMFEAMWHGPLTQLASQGRLSAFFTSAAVLHFTSLPPIDTIETTPPSLLKIHQQHG